LPEKLEKHNNFTIALSTRVCRYPIMVKNWAGGGNGYEEVNGGISMATRELRKWMEADRNPAAF